MHAAIEAFLVRHHASPYFVFGGKAWDYYTLETHSFDWDIKVMHTKQGKRFFRALLSFLTEELAPLLGSFFVGSSTQLAIRHQYVKKHQVHRFFCFDSNEGGLKRWKPTEDGEVPILDVHFVDGRHMCAVATVQLWSAVTAAQKKVYGYIHLEQFKILFGDAQRLIREAQAALPELTRFRRFWEQELAEKRTTSADLLGEAYQGVLQKVCQDETKFGVLCGRVVKNSWRVRWARGHSIKRQRSASVGK
jgi:hypothetical protein